MPLITEPDNLRLAFWKASKGKRYTQEVLDFQKNLEPNLLALREQLSSGLVDVGKYRYFKIFEPKERQICASAFSEQVLHHAMMNVCHEHFERHQVFDSYASRKGKGVHAALERAKQFLSGLDHFIKENLRIGTSVRYMDDVVLWHDDKKVLKNAFLRITEFVETNLQCSLKPEILTNCKRGLTFLGYRIYPDLVALSQQSKQRFIRKLRVLEANYDSGEWSETVCQRRALPLLAFIGHANTRNFRESILLPEWPIIERATTA